MSDLPVGIKRTPIGFRVYKRVNGDLYSKRFPASATEQDMRLWQMETELKARGRMPDVSAPLGETFADDCARYLQLVATMPSLSSRRDDLAHWIAVFGTRARHTITAQEVRRVLEQWRTVGPISVWDAKRTRRVMRQGPLAASTVNHRRTALMHLYSVLDGKSAPNPAKDAPRYQEPDPEPRAPSRATIEAILKAMPPGKYRAIFGILAWTGWPHEQIRQLQPDDIDWTQKTAYLRRRRKGKGVRPRALPLLPQALRYLREFDRHDCWGWAFSKSNLRREVRKACDAAKVDPIRVYDARHFFGTLIAAVTRDNAAVRELMLHADDRQQQRYTVAAANPRVAASVVAVAEALKRARKST